MLKGKTDINSVGVINRMSRISSLHQTTLACRQFGSKDVTFFEIIPIK